MGKKIPMLKMEGVSKVFPGVKALDNVHITASVSYTHLTLPTILLV